MTEFVATYYDGKSSARTPVRVRGAQSRLSIAGLDGSFEAPLLEVPLAEVRADAQVGSARRFLGLPGGAQLQTDDQAAVEALFPAKPLHKTVLGLERRWAAALAALVIIGAFTWWCVVYGLPVASRLAASAVPVNLEAKMGDQALATIDRTFCGPSGLEAAPRAVAQKAFERIAADLKDGFLYRLELRACPRIGPNAFALPGGAVVLTDELVKLVEADEQLAAVLAHEVGHVRHRHGLRLALQGAGLAALIAAIAGDAVSITSLAVVLPTTLLQAGYSRGFEEEADDYALERLRALGIPARHFAEVMKLLASEREGSRPGGGVPDYLSTHPATEGRIERALKRRQQ